MPSVLSVEPVWLSMAFSLSLVGQWLLLLRSVASQHWSQAASRWNIRSTEIESAIVSGYRIPHTVSVYVIDHVCSEGGL